MNNTIRVLVLNPEAPDLRSMVIKNSLEGLQEVIDGYIEVIRLENDVVMIIDEEGKLKNLTPNFYCKPLHDTILGPVIFSAEDESGELYSLDSIQLDYVEEFLEEHCIML